MSAPRRRSLGVLFVALAAVFVAVAAYAGSAGQWVIAAAAAVLSLWFGDLALRSLR